MSEEFDAGAAADRALGEVAEVGDGVAEVVDDATDAAAESVDELNDDGVDPDAGSDGSGGVLDDVGDAVPGGVRGALGSLFVAPERGPTADTIGERGMGDGGSLILDGVTDWVLDLIGRDPGDTLGPAGKIGLGYSMLVDSSGDSDDAGDGDAGGGGDGEAPDMGGVPGA